MWSRICHVFHFYSLIFIMRIDPELQEYYYWQRFWKSNYLSKRMTDKVGKILAVCPAVPISCNGARSSRCRIDCALPISPQLSRCTVVLVHSWRGAHLDLCRTESCPIASAQSFRCTIDRCLVDTTDNVFNEHGAQSYLCAINWSVPSRSCTIDALYGSLVPNCLHCWRLQSTRCSVNLVYNRFVPDRPCWIDTVQSRAVLDRYHSGSTMEYGYNMKKYIYTSGSRRASRTSTR